jgi:molybdenum cofactor synthesis domain-containing protein
MSETESDAAAQARSSSMPRTAGVLLIGNELLSGRTRDANLPYLAEWLNRRGIQVTEARIVPDEEAVIVAALNEMRRRHDYIFTTGGIGPTHDDITADCIAKAFGVGIDHHPEAVAVLERHYPPGEFTEARRRMARIPLGATLIDNPVSKAPGFQIENVFVLAGIPAVMQAMLESLGHRLVGGAPLESVTVSVFAPESRIADGLRQLQAEMPDILFGSYPFYGAARYGTSLVMRARDRARLEQAADRVRALIRQLGAEPVEGDPRTDARQDGAADHG